MTGVETLVLAVIEGFTEFLPISSTAHLMFGARLLGLTETEFLKTFELVIQLGAISAVLSLYLKKLLAQPTLLGKVMLGFLPTGLVGLVLYPWFKVWLGQLELAMVMLFVGGLFLLWFEKKFSEKDRTEIKMSDAFLIGCFQALAILPGVSRALITIVGGMLLGYSRRTAVEFSFLLALPTMLAAVGFDLLQHYQLFNLADWQTLGLGFTLALLSALGGMKFLLGLIKKNNLSVFGWYRLVLASLIFFTQR